MGFAFYGNVPLKKAMKLYKKRMRTYTELAPEMKFSGASFTIANKLIADLVLGLLIIQ